MTLLEALALPPASVPTRTPQAAARVLARRSGEHDVPFLRALYAEGRADEVAAAGWPPAQAAAFLASQFEHQHRHYHAHFADAEFLVLQAADTGAPVGRVCWRVPAADGGAATLVDLALLRAWRGHGIGSAVLSAALACADAGGRQVVLHVDPGSPARRLYERFGFVPAGGDAFHLRMHRPVAPAAVPA